MTRTHHIAVTACAIAAGVLLAAGCTPEEPVAEPTTSALPSTPPSPSPSPPPEVVLVAPERPVAMDDDGPAGAEAAAKYFLALDAYMQATGDTSGWDAMAHAECEFCSGRREQALQVADREYHWAGGGSNVVIDHTYAQDIATGIWPIDVTIAQEPATVTDSSGVIVSEIPRSTAHVRAEVALREGDWVFVELADRPN